MGILKGVSDFEVANVIKKRTKLDEIINNFLNGNELACEYVSAEKEYSSPQTKYCSLRQAAARHPGVSVVKRKGRVFLLKEDL